MNSIAVSLVLGLFEIPTSVVVFKGFIRSGYFLSHLEAVEASIR